jgi:hypothetical protein
MAQNKQRVNKGKIRQKRAQRVKGVERQVDKQRATKMRERERAKQRRERE